MKETEMQSEVGDKIYDRPQMFLTQYPYKVSLVLEGELAASNPINL